MMYPYSIYAFDYDEKGYIPMQIEAMKQNSWQGLEIRNVGEYNIVDITVGIYGDIADRWLELHRQLPELKGVFDPANFVQCGDDTLRGGQTLKAYTYHYYLHIKDALPNANAAFNAVCGILKDILEVL